MSLIPAVDAAPGNNRLLVALPPNILRLLDRDFKHVSIKQGHVCFAPGDQIDHIYFPSSGMISLLADTKNGKVVETAIIGREGALGLQSALGNRVSFFRATIRIAGSFSIIPSTRFAQAVTGNTAVRELIGHYTETLLTEARQLAACNAVHDGLSRLCRWLLQASDRIGSDRLTLTQELLAEMLGTRRTTVTLRAYQLQQRGIIEYSRGNITILDRNALEANACECYGAMKHDNLATRTSPIIWRPTSNRDGATVATSALSGEL